VNPWPPPQPHDGTQRFVVTVSSSNPDPDKLTRRITREMRYLLGPDATVERITP